MEMDDEMSGTTGSHYTTEFRMLDTRIGRWWGTDPVEHHSQSTYCAFDNNPILIYDPSGADGEGDKKTGEVTATVYFQWDKNEDHTADDLQHYIENFSNNVKETWNSYTLDNEQKVSVDNVQFLPAPEGMNASDLGKNENLLTVGNGASASENSIPGVSYIDRNARRNTGYMYLNGDGNEAAHEFGHMLGLSDRYLEGVMHSVSSYKKKESSITRLTLSLAFKEKGYNYQTNLMSGEGATLSPKQKRIAFNRLRQEKQYTKNAAVHSATDISNYKIDGIGRDGTYWSKNVRLNRACHPQSYYNRNNLNLNRLKITPYWHKLNIINKITQNQWF